VARAKKSDCLNIPVHLFISRPDILAMIRRFGNDSFLVCFYIWNRIVSHGGGTLNNSSEVLKEIQEMFGINTIYSKSVLKYCTDRSNGIVKLSKGIISSRLVANEFLSDSLIPKIKPVIKKVIEEDVDKENDSTINNQDSGEIILPFDDVITIKPEKEKTITEKYKALIDFINEKMNRRFRYVARSKARDHFNARLKDGYNGDDFIRVINNVMKDEFHIDNDFKYVTPEYLTRSTIMERYINWKPQKKSTTIGNCYQ